MKPLAVAFLLLVLPIAAVSQTAEPASHANSGAQQPGATQTVRVAELPPVSMAKDWSDWSYWLFTFFLVAVGGLQVYLLWGNLRAIERQAITMERQTTVLEKSVEMAEKSAETAKQNLEMFMSRERGHLRVELLPLEWPLKPGAPTLRYRVTLYGSTEAYVTGSCARAELSDSSEPAEDKNWFPAMSIPQVITPDHRVIEGEVHGIYPRLGLEESDVEALNAGKKFIHFRGFVKYNDVFGTERWARFRRVWELSQLKLADGTRPGHWSKRGSSKDNAES